MEAALFRKSPRRTKARARGGALRVLRSARGIIRECLAARRRVIGGRSLFRYLADVFLYRALYFVELPRKDTRRTITLDGDVQITYRLNRGDIESIREVWVEEAYRLPVDLTPDTVVDLGANIGLTALWYAKRYRPSRVICVEPVADNARLARENLSTNGVQAELLEAAVGPGDGRVAFHEARASNRGRMGQSGRRVRMVSMDTVLARIPEDVSIDLLKIDIEGAEEAVLKADLSWLRRVRSLIVEFHPEWVDQSELVRLLEERGFRYVPAGGIRWNSMDFFLRQSGDDLGEGRRPSRREHVLKPSSRR